MAFYQKIKQKINGLWYPKSITVGKPVTTDEVSDRLAHISTVSRADTYAVLKELGSTMGEFMAQGRTVKLDGLGTFYYTAIATGNGVATEEEVTAKQIAGVRVRFIPETKRTSSSKVASRSLVSNNIFWEEWRGVAKAAANPGDDTTNPDDGGNTGGDDGGIDPDA